MQKPIIRLYDTGGIGIIIKRASGVLYSNQVGGEACLQPQLEGVFVPLVSDLHNQENDLIEYFTHPEKPRTSLTLTNDDADFIDAVLKVVPHTRFITVDRSKLDDSFEAWVHVTIDSQPHEPPEFYNAESKSGFTASGDHIKDSDYDMPTILYPFYGFGATSGVLTWANSD